MEDWEGRFKRVNMPDSSVPSHREALRKKLQSDKLPSHHNRRAYTALVVVLLVLIGGLTTVYPSWAKDLWNTVIINTITLSTKDGMKVVIKKIPADECDAVCDTLMRMCEADGRRTIAFKKRLDCTEMNADSFSISTEAIIKQLNLDGDLIKNITISTPDGENTWIVNGDTIAEESVTRTIERLSEDSFEETNDPGVIDDLGPEIDNRQLTSSDFTLNQNYPNPFNPSTQISFDLKQSGPVTLKVFNLVGQEIATLLNGQISAGHHTVTFDGSNLPSGTYLYTLQAAGQQFSKTMVLTK